jgi:flagellar basal body P-ring protein FlgI
MRYLFLIILLSCTQLSAEPLVNLATIEDGLDSNSPENISDDYIRIILLTPSYRTVANAQAVIENWLGPDMVQITSNAEFLVQAPRNPNDRVAFISALLQLEIDAPASQ